MRKNIGLYPFSPSPSGRWVGVRAGAARHCALTPPAPLPEGEGSERLHKA